MSQIFKVIRLLVTNPMRPKVSNNQLVGSGTDVPVMETVPACGVTASTFPNSSETALILIPNGLVPAVAAVNLSVANGNEVNCRASNSEGDNKEISKRFNTPGVELSEPVTASDKLGSPRNVPKAKFAKLKIFGL